MKVIGKALIAFPFFYGSYQYYMLSKRQVPKEATMTFQEYCEYKGLSVQSHLVTTQDGYNLTLFRVSKGKEPDKNKTPVIMVHGLTHSATSFIISQNSTPPAVRLIDEGYDVWLLNTRGNYYSRTHQTLDPKSKEYWQWCSNHIGQYDIPASIDYVLKGTGKKRINYIGHSQGGFVGLYCLTMLPKYGEKVNVIVVWAPPGGGKIAAKSQYLADLFKDSFLQDLESKGINFIADWSPVPNDSAVYAYAFPYLAAWKYKDKYDVSLEKEDASVLSVYLQQFSGGTSVMNLRYLQQLIQRNAPIAYMFDYGKDENIKKYGQEIPPIIHYANIRAKIAVMYGKHDDVCTMDNGENLAALLPKRWLIFKKFDYEVDHAGFAVSPNQKHMDDVVKIFKEHELQ